jgi:hypothetical protein
MKLGLMPLADLNILDPCDDTPGDDSSVAVKGSDEKEVAEDLMDLTSSLADLRSLIESPSFDQDDFKSVAEDLKGSAPPPEPNQDKSWTQSAWSKGRKRQSKLRQVSQSYLSKMKGTSWPQL